MPANRPDLGFWMAFNGGADPNDPSRVPAWSDLTDMVTRIDELSRGRQYELGVAQAGMPRITYRDPSEHLNPANTASPYAPNVQPYRDSLGVAMWPNGGLGNLLNTHTWRPNDQTAPDPSFEAYTNGAALPSWLSPVGGVTATVTTTTPQQGTKALTYTVAASTTPQGVALAGWAVPCWPGRQFTTSLYVRQSSASTQRLTVGGLTLARDAFTRAVSNGWGTADIGGAWTSTGGSASDFSVTSGMGQHSIGTLNVRRFTTLAVTAVDTDLYTTVVFEEPVTGPSNPLVYAGLVARYTNVDNHYRAEFSMRGPGAGSERSYDLSLTKRVGGVSTVLAAVSQTLLNFPATATIRLRFQTDGVALRLKFWLDRFDEPIAWNLTTTDSTVTGGGAVGYTTFADPALTNTLPFVQRFDDLRCVGSLASATTATTGAYVRLSVTYTADQPYHNAQLATVGTAVAGTVLVDAVQHEPGTLTAFTTAGPAILPLYRLYGERFPRRYTSAGFEGWADVPSVDALAALQAIKLDPEYVAAVLGLEPTFFWPMSGGGGESAAAEISGNQGPALRRFDTKYGPGDTPEFGAAINYPGHPDGTGVRFTPVNPAGTNQAGSLLAAGRDRPTFGFPDAFSSSWGATLSAWVQITATSPISSQWIASLTDPAGRDFVLLVHFSGVAEAWATQSALMIATSSPKVDNGQPHHLVATIEQISGGNTVVKIYVDGVLAGTDTETTATMGLFTLPWNTADVGGRPNGANAVNGVVNSVAMWDRALPASEITALHSAGATAFAGELTGTRIARHLDQRRYVGPRRLSPGSSTMQAPTWTGDMELLTDTQNTAVVEDGTIWVAPDGHLVFEGRQQRWLRLTPSGVFGEDDANGEIPYLEGIEFDCDPTFVFANVQVSRVNGTAARGGAVADISATARRYFSRANPADAGDYATDMLVQSKADWTFHTHRVPTQRVSVITIDLASNPALAPYVLRMEIGQRWTVRRRAKAANSGAGITMSADYFIEHISHPVIDLEENGEWVVRIALSPIGAAPVSLQPWILGHSTYGVLNSTTILGW